MKRTNYVGHYVIFSAWCVSIVCHDSASLNLDESKCEHVFLCNKSCFVFLYISQTNQYACSFILSLLIVQNLLYLDLVDIIRRSSKHYQQPHLKKDMQGHLITFVEHWPSSSWPISLVFQWHRLVFIRYGSLFLCHIEIHWY